MNAVTLEVLSTRLIHRLLLPPTGPKISDAVFTLLDQSAPGDRSSEGSKSAPNHWTVVVEEHLHDISEIHRNVRPRAVWIRQPIALDAEWHGGVWPAPAATLRQSNKMRKASLRILANMAPSLIIVSDEKSKANLGELDIRATVAPPAISDSLFSRSTDVARSGSVVIPGETNAYQNLYLEALGNRDGMIAATQEQYEKGFPEVRGAVLGVSLGTSPLRSFPVEALAHLASGHTLIAEPLYPSHGLEAGIDYFEVTSPQELLHVVDYLRRNPQATRLMAYRGRQKAEYFRSSRIWQQIFSFGDSSLPPRD